MPSMIFWLVALGPLGLVLIGCMQGFSIFASLRTMHIFVRSLTAVSMLSALAVLGWVSLHEPLQAPLIGTKGLGFSLYLDTISTTMFALVSFIGFIVAVYSRNYLAGDPGQGRFIKWISLTLGSVLLLMISGNLFQFLLAWVSTSLFLNRLLTFYPERPSAILAARKKWVVSRVGDLLLLSSMVLLYRKLGSLEFTSIFEAAQNAHAKGASEATLVVVAALFAFAALLKSAQFPVHGWLLEVMETPTPVSALLHAGIINAGGFLLIRFSHLLTLSPFAMNTLIVIGALTALLGSLVMLTQTSVKVSLAYSTIAQMGFMMLECGLGVFSAAILHIIAHSLYKAHAFLSSGEAVKLAQLRMMHFQSSRFSSTLTIAVATLIALVTVTLVGIAFDSTLLTKPGSTTLTYIFAIGVATLLADGLEGRLKFPFLARIFVGVFGVAVLFYGIQLAAEVAFVKSLQVEKQELGSFDLIFRMVLILLFGAAMVLQRAARNKRGDHWLTFYTHLSNGFYINTVANRLAIRYWPSAAPQSAAPSYIPTYRNRGES